MKPDRPTCNVTVTLTQRMDDLTGLSLWGGSCLTGIVKTNSPCLSSHDEDVNTFQFQQAIIFTATLLFQPKLITTMYIQLQMIINHQFVVLHTYTQTLFHTQHIREMQEIFRRAHNNKRQYFIEPFLIRRRLPYMTLVTCGWPNCASLKKQQAKSTCFYQSSWEKSCKNMLRWFLVLILQIYTYWPLY